MEDGVKILFSDIFNRKSFDIINIIKKKYSFSNFIFTICDDNYRNKLKLKLIYNAEKYEILSKKNFDNDIKFISTKYINEKIVFLPIEEDTTESFIRFIDKFGPSNFKFCLPKIESFVLSKNKKNLNVFCEENGIDCPRLITKRTLKTKTFAFQ